MDFLTKKLEAAHLSANASDEDSVVKVVVISEESHLTADLIAEFSGQTNLALDCEGVDLGRMGDLCIIQLSTLNTCLLFDMCNIEASASPEVMSFLKSILEDPTITKIIHDCKMDADALFHLCSITLSGVHDTQSWDQVLRYEEKNVNDTLRAYGCASNVVRDASVYKANYRFWETRPLTAQMIEWAAGDVTSLFELAEKQRSRAKDLAIKLRCQSASEKSAAFIRSCITELTFVSKSYMGRFIGTGGRNLHAAQAATGCFFQFLGTREEARIRVIVYGEDEAAIAKGLASARRFQ